MAERLVDVVDKNGMVVHTYPITVGKPGSAAPDAAFQNKSLEAAIYGQLVPTEDLSSLTTRMHVSRGGRMEPYSDAVPCTSQTKVSLEQDVRLEAYRLWSQSGEPAGRADEFWMQAHEEQLRARAYTLWQQEGSPSGRADEFWAKTLLFEQF